MSRKLNGYRLPQNLIEVMDMMSVLNVKIEKLGNEEMVRLYSDGICNRQEDCREMSSDLFSAAGLVEEIIEKLGDYAGWLIKSEMYLKHQEQNVFEAPRTIEK